MQLTSQRITSSSAPLFAAVYELYAAAFPVYQRRGPVDMDLAFAQPAYRLDAWLADNEFAALMSWWDFADMRYVEHLAVSPAKRSLGLGRKLLHAWLPLADTPVVLEIDPVRDEITRRRLAFYQRAGFVPNSHIRHTVPSLQERAVMTPGELLSWPNEFSLADYARLQEHLDSSAFACIGHDQPTANLC